MKKICLVADMPNWAFDKIAHKIKKELAFKYCIEIDYFNVYTSEENLYDFIERHEDCDLIHFFWRKSLLMIESEEFKQKVAEKGMNIELYIEQKRNKLSSGVYDFLYLKEEDIDIYKKIFNNYIKQYYVSSKKLYNVYSKIEKYKKPLMIVHDICEPTNYKPINIERLNVPNIEHRELVIGWVGNSVRKVDEIDLKGLHTIIIPVLKELKEEGYNIKEWYADRNEKWRTTEEMLEYYSQIDVCLCTSIHEGTPLPVLEAMYCGVPIIATDVGIVREAFGEKQKEFIIGDRENGKNDENIKKKLKQKIVYLYNNRNMFKVLSEENLISIDKYDGGKIIKEFENYFDECLKD